MFAVFVCAWNCSDTSERRLASVVFRAVSMKRSRSLFSSLVRRQEKRVSRFAFSSTSFAKTKLRSREHVVVQVVERVRRHERGGSREVRLDLPPVRDRARYLDDKLRHRVRIVLREHTQRCFRRRSGVVGSEGASGVHSTSPSSAFCNARLVSSLYMGRRRAASNGVVFR